MDIKELALKIAEEMGGNLYTLMDRCEDFATRMIAAYLKEQEPDGWIDGEGDPYDQHGWGKKPPKGWTTCEENSYPVFRAPPFPAIPDERIATIEQQNAELVAALKVIAWNADMYLPATMRQVATEALSKVKQP